MKCARILTILSDIRELSYYKQTYNNAYQIIRYIEISSNRYVGLHLDENRIFNVSLSIFLWWYKYKFASIIRGNNY